MASAPLLGLQCSSQDLKKYVGVLEAIAQFVVLMLLSRVGQLRVLLKAALLHLPEDKCAECV